MQSRRRAGEARKVKESVISQTEGDAKDGLGRPRHMIILYDYMMKAKLWLSQLAAASHRKTHLSFWYRNEDWASLSLSPRNLYSLGATFNSDHMILQTLHWPSHIRSCLAVHMLGFRTLTSIFLVLFVCQNFHICHHCLGAQFALAEISVRSPSPSGLLLSAWRALYAAWKGTQVFKTLADQDKLREILTRILTIYKITIH